MRSLLAVAALLFLTACPAKDEPPRPATADEHARAQGILGGKLGTGSVLAVLQGNDMPLLETCARAAAAHKSCAPAADKTPIACTAPWLTHGIFANKLEALRPADRACWTKYYEGMTAPASCDDTERAHLQRDLDACVPKP